MPNDRYLDVTPAITGGYAVVLVHGHRCAGQALMDTAHDVAACAALAGLAVLTSDTALTQACRVLGVATALPPPPFGKKRCRYEAMNDRTLTRRLPRSAADAAGHISANVCD